MVSDQKYPKERICPENISLHLPASSIYFRKSKEEFFVLFNKETVFKKKWNLGLPPESACLRSKARP
jgi:hypothetical protein